MSAQRAKPSEEKREEETIRTHAKQEASRSKKKKEAETTSRKQEARKKNC
jgi:hypothetical protein